MKSTLLTALAVIPLGMAAVLNPSIGTATTIALPAGTVVGITVDEVEYYRGIPYAKPPTGSRRLKVPERMKSFGIIQATGIGPSCPQMTSTSPLPVLNETLLAPGVVQALSIGSSLGNETEDCLTVSVMRPKGTKPHEKLPVLFWIHGGGFEQGSAQSFNGSVLIPQADAQDKPFILVAVNYRLNSFGFLGGKEMLIDGSTNLGLLDQRMGLEWVADNIEAFGGNREAVTIAGESAGATSVFDQMALFDGDNTYQGRPLFRAAIMNSGSVLPLEKVDENRAQNVFDTVVAAAGCPSIEHPDKLVCLRNVSYERFRNATYSVPQFLSYDSVALSYTPRPDGKLLTASTDILAMEGKLTKVPIIIGDLQDEVI
jgi:carboxylesterase type B